MLTLLPDSQPHCKRKKTEVYTSPLYNGWEIEYLYHAGPPCQPIPGVGEEPASVEIVSISFHGFAMNFKLLEDLGCLDREDFETELSNHILARIPQ